MNPTRVIILPVRMYEGQIEVLLKLRTSPPFTGVSEISGKIEDLDPSPIFCAARVFAQEFLGMRYKLDEKNVNWDSREFRKWLGIICSCFEFYESEKSCIYFIEDFSLLSRYQGKTNPENQFSWYPISMILSRLSDFAPSLSIIIFYELGGIHEFIQSRVVDKPLFGILNTETDESWENVYEACYQGYFQRENERWLSFRVFKGQFPSPEDESRFAGFIITGSNCAVYEAKPWMERLYGLIRRIVGRNGAQKLMGFCFGHQAIATALGGSVQRMKGLEYDTMLLYKNRVYMKKEFLETHYVKNSLGFKRINVTRGIYLNQAHGDFVEKLPPMATHFGFSDDIENEIMGIGDHVLSMQSHPEFSESMMIYRWLPEILRNDPELEEYRKRCIQSYYLGELHAKEMRVVCEHFLKESIQQ